MDTTRVLPQKVMQNIFCHALITLEDPPIDITPLTALNNAPMSLIRVSRRWRSVAITHPPAWTSLILPPCPLHEDRARIFLANLAQWLSASRSLPLSFSVHIISPANPKSPRYWNMLVSESHRWKDVSLIMGVSGCSTGTGLALPLSNDSPMPILERLVIRFPSAITSPLQTCFLNAPNLRCATLHGISPTTLLLPPSTLAKLDLRNLVLQTHTRAGHEYNGAVEFLEVLQKFTELEELRVDIGGVEDSGLKPLEHPIEMRALRRVHLSLYDQESPDSFFHFWFYSVLAPNLQSLTVHSDFNFLDILIQEDREKIRRSTELRSAFRDFLTPCKNSLRELKLYNLGEDENILSILAILPNLVSLTLTMETVTPSILRSLTLAFAQDGSGILEAGHALHLKQICLVGNQFAPERESNLHHVASASNPCEAFADMIESRWRVPSPEVLEVGEIDQLVEVVLTDEAWEGMAKMHGESYERFGKMWDEGLKVSTCMVGQD